MKNLNDVELSFERRNDQDYITTKHDNQHLGKQVHQWRINAIDSILIVDSLKNDTDRQSKILKRDKRNSIITWAVFGGILDSLDGDDGIMDGILLGGLFGAVTSRSEINPVAHVVLQFTNGDRLALTANQAELSRLIEVKQEDELIDGSSTRPLTIEEKDALTKQKELGIASFFTLLAIFIATVIVLIEMIVR